MAGGFESFVPPIAQPGDASSTLADFVYGGGKAKEAVFAKLGDAADTALPPGIDAASWQQLQDLIKQGKNVQFDTAAENAASGIVPNYILGADGKLHPTSNATVAADGKIHIQVQNSDPEAARNAARQLQVAAVQEKIAYYMRAHPNEKSPPDFLSHELYDAQTAAGPDGAAPDQGMDKVQWPGIDQQPPSSLDTPEPTPASMTGGEIDDTPRGGFAADCGPSGTGSFAGRGGFDGSGYFHGNGAESEGSVYTGSRTAGDSIGPGVQAKAEDIFNYLHKLGFNDAQASGILGNILTESSCRTDAHNSAEGAVGLCQWEGSRRTDLINFAAAHHESPTDMKTQLDFMMYELTHKESGALAQLKQAQTPEQAAFAFQHYYERSASLGNRAVNARNFYDRLAGHTGSVPVA